MISATTEPPARADEADIVIVGGGPTGLMLAIELRLGGAHPIVLERLPGISEIPKGNGLVGQVVPMLDYRGLLDRLRQDATWAGPVPRFSFGPLQMDFSRLGTSPLHILTIPQRRLEQLLEQRLAELGGTIRRGHELTALSPHDDVVTLDIRGPGGDYRLRARYLVGCDGAHSLVRKQAGIGFPGTTSPEVSRIGRVRLPTAKITRRGGEVKVPGIGRLKLMQQVRTPRGTYSLAPLALLDKNAPADIYIVYTSEDDPTADLSAPMTLGELSASARRVLGGDLLMTDPQRLTQLAGNSRLADRYQSGRILLAGDAAHIFGGGGSLNIGLLDAVNLGWKLAAQVQGRAPADLLDSYHAERHLAGQHAILHTRAQKALTVISQSKTSEPGEVSPEGAEALRELFGDVLQHPEPLRRIRELLRQPEQLRHVGEMIEGSDVRYPIPATSAQRHPLLGKLAPDLRLETRDGRTRVAELMRAARGVLLDLTADSAVAEAASDWAGLVNVITARCLTEPAPAAALLMRPDGYVAWATEPNTPDPVTGINQALRTYLIGDARARSVLLRWPAGERRRRHGAKKPGPSAPHEARAEGPGGVGTRSGRDPARPG
jgi:2-polyprenyl-6-methoxyphenol hydroxylase-like FAD-dependent oxidoreductase